MSLLNYSVSNSGLAALSFDGKNYITSPQSRLFMAAVFRDNSNVEQIYPGQDVSSAAGRRHSASSFTHLYSLGRATSIGLTVAFSTPDQRTLKIDFTITNNDPSRTLARIGIDLYIPLPGSITSRSDGTLFPVRIGGHIDAGYSVPTFMVGGEWGSLAMWPSAYDNHNQIYIQAVENPLRLQISNAIPVPQDGPVLYEEDPIAPHRSWQHSLTIRLDSATDIPLKDIAAESHTAVRRDFPPLLYWPDKRPIARWFVSDKPYSSASNPRGYLYDSGLNALDIPTFRRAIKDFVSYRIRNNMDLMDPKPQGVLVWDLEGSEYLGFRYGGCPNLLAQVAPEMDAVADDLFKLFRDAGYKPGLTIRPDNIASTAPFDHTQVGTQADALNILMTRIGYSIERWGCEIFYIDSDGIDHNRLINQSTWQTIMRTYPKILLIPETTPILAYGSAADYRDGRFESIATDRTIYTNAFSYLVPDERRLGNSDYYHELVDRIREGSIVSVDGWWWPDSNRIKLQAWRDAGIRK